VIRQLKKACQSSIREARDASFPMAASERGQKINAVEIACSDIFTILGTRSLGLHIGGHLPLHYDFLQGLQDRLALCQCEAQRGRGEVPAPWRPAAAPQGRAARGRRAGGWGAAAAARGEKGLWNSYPP
jgi:hypothetical protein